MRSPFLFLVVLFFFISGSFGFFSTAHAINPDAPHVSNFEEPSVPSSPLRTSRNNGDPVDYGDGKHPGLDWELGYGTPIIASSPGQVKATRAGYFEGGKKCMFRNVTISSIEGVQEADNFCGYYVIIKHNGYFRSFSHHLKSFFVNVGDEVERGELIGVSGSDEFGNWPHLHFSIFKEKTNPIYHSNNYDPDTLWLSGNATCFDPKKDYSETDQGKITHPVACGDYNKKLQNMIKQSRK